MPVPNQIRIAELDFDQILLNLITFMKKDPAFADYDFAGSGLRLISRVLAYTTFYNNYYLTQAINEGFLDTAQLRSSVAAHARMLGYTIHGVQSARVFANVAVQLADASAGQVTLPQNTQFTLQANTQFSFYNLDDAVLMLNANTSLYEGTDLELVEGEPHQYRFPVDLSNPTQRFIIPNANIDYQTITVNVQDSIGSNVAVNWTRADSVLTIGPTDPVFFVEESFNAFPELKFGNGVVGQPLVDGNIVIVNYYRSRGMDGNNIRGPFEITSANIAGFVRGVTVTDGNTASSMGGTDLEDIDNARFLAPLSYQAQNRCVTADDYKTIILQQFGENIGAINVFGGEKGDPDDPLERPKVGRVFIVLKPKIGLRFTDIVKEGISHNLVAPRSIVGVIPEVIDPDYIYIVVSTSVKFDPKATTLTKLQLSRAISNNIVSFAQQHIEKFDTTFRFSKFVRIIDDTNEAVLSSLTRLDLEKRIYPALHTANQYVLKFGSPIRKVSGTSAILEATDHRFTYTNDLGVQQAKCFFYEQDSKVHIAYRNTQNMITIFKANIGTVDLTTGLVTITNFKPDATENDVIDVRLRIIPTVNDFTPHLNQLFTLDPAEITVQLLNDATAVITDQISFFQGGILP
jgi:hypothetical protein